MARGGVGQGKRGGRIGLKRGERDSDAAITCALEYAGRGWLPRSRGETYFCATGQQCVFCGDDVAFLLRCWRVLLQTTVRHVCIQYRVLLCPAAVFFPYDGAYHTLTGPWYLLACHKPLAARYAVQNRIMRQPRFGSFRRMRTAPFLPGARVQSDGEQVETLLWIKFFPQPLMNASSPAEVKIPWLATLSLFSLWGLLFVAVSEDSKAAVAVTKGESEGCTSVGSLLDGCGGAGGGGGRGGGVSQGEGHEKDVVNGSGKTDGACGASSDTKLRRDR